MGQAAVFLVLGCIVGSLLTIPVFGVNDHLVFDDCMEQMQEFGRIERLTVSPWPLVIPGNITLSGTIQLARSLTGNIRAELEMKKKLGIFGFIKIPCINHRIGSCSFKNVCGMLDPASLTTSTVMPLSTTTDGNSVSGWDRTTTSKQPYSTTTGEYITYSSTESLFTTTNGPYSVTPSEHLTFSSTELLSTTAGESFSTTSSEYLTTSAGHSHSSHPHTTPPHHHGSTTTTNDVSPNDVTTAYDFTTTTDNSNGVKVGRQVAEATAEDSCPALLAVNHIPCHCPFSAGTYVIPPTELALPSDIGSYAVIAKGDWQLKVQFFDDTTGHMIMCQNTTITLLDHPATTHPPTTHPPTAHLSTTHPSTVHPSTEMPLVG